MTSEPSEEAIANFVSFTSTSREQAITFLKANNLDSNKAINAYFEDPTGPQPEPANYQTNPSFHIEHPDPLPDPALVAPTRPPSTLDLKDQAQTPEYTQPNPPPAQAAPAQPQKGLTLAEQEEQELQQAVAMSLIGQQETGVTSTNRSNFGKATRDHYDEGAWAVTLFNSSSREIIISPDPADRKRVNNEPAFLRPCQDNLYLGGLLTILHAVPLAREALLFRSRTLPKYGHDPQWWNGQPINLPKIVTMHDAHHGDTEWDDILYEVQRLMAFLDSTDRAFGSPDALAGLKGMPSYESEASIGKSLQAWQEAAVRADPENQLAAVFTSTAYKQNPTDLEYEAPIHSDFSTLEVSVEPDHGQTLYDALDRTIWADQLGEELDDVWLEHIAEVFTIRLDSPDTSKSLDVKIPSTFYPDRYLASCREMSRDFRARRQEMRQDILKIENLANRFSVTKSLASKGLTSKQVLEKATVALSALPQNLSQSDNDPNQITAEAERVVNELRQVCSKLEDKLQELERRKQDATEALRNYSKALTEPSKSLDEPPHNKYTLRGVCTEPHVTYVLRPTAATQPGAESSECEWQWWRISFSTEDAKARHAESDDPERPAPKNADVIGYTARQVREIEVLRAAREESKSVLLVYANNNALKVPVEPAPPQLLDFVAADNRAFEAEFQESQTTEQPSGAHVENLMDIDETITADQQGASAGPSPSKVNVFDYQVPHFDEEMDQAQEMQEKGRPPLLSRANTNPTMESTWHG
ncbi:ubiquitin interaction motif protein [Aspergillus terreus]|uniref:Ubiquitin interaction motif protein n=1 Tax=Aspergillus terreus TaxID=33178 RepID=A0A5M3ZB81_ASPTE|nr:hypothetical protein ATETN484_0013020700 [Aspergillus terreus]GFF20441.1 ubiquitin interaction motif protein [Aspergillus terreus]